MRNEGERVVIGRVVKGGAAERSGQLHPGDEVLEVNGLKLKGKSVHDICDTLCQMTGKIQIKALTSKNSKKLNIFHYRNVDLRHSAGQRPRRGQGEHERWR